jgi:MSHA biogenesis protein MshJ
MKKFLLDWWDRRNGRERLVMQLAALVVIAALADQLALASMRKETARVRADLTGAQVELDRIHAAIEERTRLAVIDGQARRSALALRRQQAEAAIQVAETDLITPQQMQRQLAVILDRFPQMRVVAMTTNAPVPALAPNGPNGPNGPIAARDAHDAAAAQDPNGAREPGAPLAPSARPALNGLYEHGMEITVEGRYLDLIGYLEVLEHAPYRVYWRNLALTVDPTKGVPVTRIGLFTLSRDPTWLRL